MQRERLVAYGVALATSALALLVRLLLSPLLAQQPALIIFIMPIVISAWYGGLWPGLLATMVCALVGDYFFVQPAYSLVPVTIAEAVHITTFVVEGVLISMLSEALHRVRQREAEQQALLASVVQSAADAISSTTLDGTILTWNPGAEKLYGYRADEVIGRNVSMLWPPGYSDQGPTPLERVRCGAAIELIETRRVRKDGREIDVSLTLSPITNAAGHTIGTSAITHDITERKRAEESLRQSEAKLRMIIEQLPALVWTTDGDLRVLSTTGTALAQLGRPSQDYVGKTFPELVGTQERDAPVLAAHLRALAGESAAYTRQVGERVFEAHVEPMRDAQEQIIGCVGLALDVTTRKRAEQRLAAQYHVSETLAQAVSIEQAVPHVLQALGEHLQWDYGALWVVDRNDAMLRCTQTWQSGTAQLGEFAATRRQTLFAPGEGLLGSVWASGEPCWITDTTTETNFPRLQHAAFAGLRSGFGLPIKLDGRVIAVMEFLSHDLRQPDPNILEMATALSGQLGQFIERKGAEEKLRVRERQQAAVAELGRRALATPDLAMLMNAAAVLVVQALDVEYCKIMELLGDRSALLLRWGAGLKPGYVGHTRMGMNANSQAGYTLQRNEPVVTEDLHTETRFRVPPILHDHGVVSTISVVIHGQDRPFGVLQADATRHRAFTDDDVHFLQAAANVLATAVARKAFEERLAWERAETGRLAEIDRLRHEFMSTISHDLRTPLTAAGAGIGMLESTLAERLRPDERSLLQNARRNMERLGMLIDDLLTYNQLEAGVLHLGRTLLDLRTVVIDALATMHALFEQKGQVVTLDLPESLPTDGDRRRLEQVVVNLLGNAHEHTPTGTHITITGHQEADEVGLTVSDTGPGVPAAALDMIFQRFQRLDATQRGSGLGLAIAKGIIELHGGRIWAESHLGGGATFSLALPHAHDESEEGGLSN